MQFSVAQAQGKVVRDRVTGKLQPVKADKAPYADKITCK